MLLTSDVAEILIKIDIYCMIGALVLEVSRYQALFFSSVAEKLHFNLDKPLYNLKKASKANTSIARV